MQFFYLAAAALLSLTPPASAAPAPTSASAPVAAPPSSRFLGPRAVVPAKDPFYTPPAGFEKEAPGTILRNRTITASLFSIIPNPVHAWQLLYRTTAVNGSAIATVTTVFQPLGAHKDRFVSYASAYDSSSTQCNPSYAYQLGSDTTDNLETNIETVLIEGYLLQGYTVSSSDYEGPDAAFGSGHLEGMCLLDSLRAVSSFDALGFTSDTPDIVGVGYSGGAIAAGWAATLQGSYAPELPVKAWVHGGTPVNLTSVLLYDANTTNSGYLFAALAGLSKPSTYGAQLNPLLGGILTEKGEAAIKYANSHCVSDDMSEYSYTSPLSFDFQDLGPALMDHPVMDKVMKDNNMGAKPQLTPVTPVFILHARQDEIIPYADAASLAERYCARKVDVTFISYGQGGHLSSGLAGFPDTYRFVNNAFAGNLTKGCTYKSELNSILNPIGLVAELEPVLSKLGDLLHNVTTTS